MRAGLAAISLVLLAACAGQPVVQPTERGSSRADGIVAMTSIRTPYQPVAADWTTADADATRRCRSWGHDRQRFAGWREACRAWDHYGTCTVTRVTRFYDCEG
jgi:hypothetical protein